MKFYTYKVSDWRDEGKDIDISSLEELMDFVENTEEMRVIIWYYKGKWELIDYDDYIE